MMLHIRLVAAAFLAALIVLPSVSPGADEREEEWNRRQPPDLVMDVLGIEPGMTVAEFGAGRGRYALPVAARLGSEGHLYAEDIDADALAHLDGRIESGGIANITTVLGTGTDPKLPPGSCDFIYCINTWHHIESPVPLLRNLQPALKPGGSLVIIEHSAAKAEAQGFDWHCTPTDEVLAKAREAGLELTAQYSMLELDEIYVFRTSDRDEEEARVAWVIRESIRWAVAKDRPLLESLIAQDENLLIFNPDGLEPTRGWAAFVPGFDFWMDPRFVVTRFRVRDLRVRFSPARDVAWFATVLDDCATWDGGDEGCWADTRWTGVLEKRADGWKLVQMHFSFASDRQGG